MKIDNKIIKEKEKNKENIKKSIKKNKYIKNKNLLNKKECAYNLHSSNLWIEQKEKLAKRIIRDLYSNNLILTSYRNNPSGWKLKSGLWSPYYIQLRKLIAYPKLLKNIIKALIKLIKNEVEEKINLIVGLPMTGIPISTGISLQKNIPMAFTRKKYFLNQNYGDHNFIEGILKNDSSYLIIDDVVSSFESKNETIDLINKEIEKYKIKNLNLINIIVLIDREQNNNQNKKLLKSLIQFKSSGLNHLEDLMHPEEYSIIKKYLETSKYF